MCLATCLLLGYLCTLLMNEVNFNHHFVILLIFCYSVFRGEDYNEIFSN